MFEKLLRIDKYVVLTFLLVGGEAIHYFIPKIKSGSWDQALQECERSQSSLPIIRNKVEQEALFQYLRNQSMNYNVWTAGKQSDKSKWTWINGQPFIGRTTTLPDSVTAGGLNRILSQLTYEVRNPAYSANYVCEFKSNDAKCTEDNYELVRQTNGCLLRISSKNASWYEARNDCLEIGGDLPVLDGIDLDSLIQWKLWEMDVFPLWLGFRKSSWTWYSNNNNGSTDDIKYTNWYSRNPDRGWSYCIAIDARNGKWTPFECVAKLGFVCENREKRTDITEISTSEPTITSQPPSDLSSDTNSQDIQINRFFELKEFVWLGIAVAFVIICIIIVIFAIRKHNKSSKNTRTSSTGHELLPPANPVGDGMHGVYAEIPLANKSDTEADNIHRGIYYASLEFENSENKSNLSPAKRTYPQGDEHAEVAIGKAEDEQIGCYANYNPTVTHLENPNHSQQHHPTGAIYSNL